MLAYFSFYKAPYKSTISRSKAAGHPICKKTNKTQNHRLEGLKIAPAVTKRQTDAGNHPHIAGKNQDKNNFWELYC